MAESFDNFDNILSNWVEDKVKEYHGQAIEQVREVGRRKNKAVFVLENNWEIMLEQSR